MADLQSKRLIVLKGLLFLVILAISVALLWAAAPGWRTACLLALVIWSSARLYYFLFYVLERYVDPTLNYSGLVALIQKLLSRVRRGRGQAR
jgi:hypothetical protein